MLEPVEGGREPPIVGWFGENLTLSAEVRQTPFCDASAPFLD